VFDAAMRLSWFLHGPLDHCITRVGKWFVQRTNPAIAFYSLLLSLGFAWAAQIAKLSAEPDWRVVWNAMGHLLGSLTAA
jgi:hypothetical protein